MLGLPPATKLRYAFLHLEPEKPRPECERALGIVRGELDQGNGHEPGV